MDAEDGQLGYLSFFDLNEQQFPWRESRPEDIRARRSLLANQLFFDVLLQVGGIQEPDEVYPPYDVASLRRLLSAVEGTTYDSMKKDCLMYYLLKWHGDGRELKYAEGRCISPHYASIAEAYWHLDTGERLGHAVSLLSDIRIVNECTSKIISALSLSPNATSLILKYYRICKPALTDLTDLRRCLVALAETSLMEAWQFQRSFPDKSDTREGLLQALMDWSLSGKALARLLPLPFTSYEESVIQAYVASSPPHLTDQSVTILRDFICVRLIKSSKYIQAAKFDHQYAGSSRGVRGSWSTERKSIINDVIAVLPSVQRKELTDELGETSRAPARKSLSMASQNGTGSERLGMSWEDLGPLVPTPDVAASGSGSISKGMPNGFAGPRVSNPSASLSRSTIMPRQSLGGAPYRPPVPNGVNTFTPGGSTSANIHARMGTSTSLPAISAASTRPILPGTLGVSTMNGNRFGMSTSTSAPALTAPTALNGNGIALNGTPPPKTNAFLTGNAFYKPPVVETAPHTTNGNVDHRPESTAPLRSSLLSTQPPKPSVTSEKVEQVVNDTSVEDVELASPVESAAEAEADRTQDSLSTDGENENGDLSFSLFGNGGGRGKSPYSDDGAVSGLGNLRAISEQRQIPGAFVSDTEEEAVMKPPPVPTAASRTAAKSRLSGVGRVGGNTRKRSAREVSGEGMSEFEAVKQSIPGTLFEEDENAEEVPERSESISRARRGQNTSASNGRNGAISGSTTASLSAGKRRGKGSRSSRASSVDPGEVETKQPVRRSSRLSHAAPAPAIERKVSVGGSGRPRKSTRTSGALGATATGHGSSKKT